MTKEFDLAALLAERGAERYELHAKHLNHQLPRMLHTIGFDKVYERAEGAHSWDADGNDYLDMLAGFAVMGLGRHHPVVRKALHDVLDAWLADLTRFDCPPLPGLLAEKLLSYSPHLDRVFFGNSGTEAVETALKFARYATGRQRILYCTHAFHGLTTGSLSVNGEDGFRKGFAPLLPDTAVPLGDLEALAASSTLFEVGAK
ncbi:Aspartate aminotransferase family protein OS=Streptomyces tendae OX=1932 GN=GUR47_02665 PE=3 SV=1 [Streptomyces tendae]